MIVRSVVAAALVVAAAPTASAEAPPYRCGLEYETVEAAPLQTDGRSVGKIRLMRSTDGSTYCGEVRVRQALRGRGTTISHTLSLETPSGEGAGYGTEGPGRPQALTTDADSGDRIKYSATFKGVDGFRARARVATTVP